MTLETATLLASISFVEIAGAVILTLFWMILSKRDELHAGSLLWWIAGLLFGAAGTYLVALRGHVSDTWSIGAANTFLIMATGMRCAGFASILKRPKPLWPFVAAVVVWISVCSTSSFFEDFVTRVIFVQSCLAASCLWLVWAAFRSNQQRLYSVSLLGVTSALEATAYIWFMVQQKLTGFDDVYALIADQVTAIYLVILMISLVMTIVLPVGMVIEILVLRYKEQAFQDPLTGLPNRRAFWNSCHGWMSKDGNKAKPYGFVLFDIDDLKTTNETFSLAMGDAVLQLFGKVAREAVGERGFAGRLGGEEFAIFLPGMDAKESLVIAQRVSRRLGVECEEASGGKLIISTGAGVVGAGPGTAPERSLEMAGRLLQKAKKLGRGQIMIELNANGKASILRLRSGSGPQAKHSAA